ncbi:uncharacterized protein N7482_009432 [Penicillium canariense]|uniref:RRM domain-containing protein n=1 Tax=Penicillium canariense TaxID=189055 RepID=A0A9W9HT65_9EURO|nr:uncharacterized protein N7482_009432 [Penicillium canariense]KAJ5152954.1 hypothetical protein N7482_009432 [Penicillium canariense]
MSVQLVVPNAEPKYPRGDRLHEEPSAKNAQGLFSPDACIFVGNLSTKVPTEKLAEDLKSVFTQFGSCHVKIKQDKKKGLPGAFVQFERVEDASAALASEKCTVLHDRLLRTERAKGRRTACLGIRTGQSITAHDVLTALGGRGSLEVYSIEPQQMGIQTGPDVAKVTFAFVDDCRDAIKYFQKNDKYYLQLLDMDGSPLLQESGGGPPRPKPHNATFSTGSGNSQQRSSNRPHRNGPPNHRGGYRSFPKYHHQPIHHENVPPRGGRMPSSHVMFNGIPYSNETQQPSYPHPPPPPVLNGYGGPPLMFNGPPPYIGPHPSPDGFASPMTNGPFIVCSQPAWTAPDPAFYPGPFVASNGYLSPQASINNHSGYFGHVSHPGYSDPYPAPLGYMVPSSPNVNSQYNTSNLAKGEPAGGQDASKYKAFGKASGLERRNEPAKTKNPEQDMVGGVPLHPKTPEKAPRLIRVCDSDDEEDAPRDSLDKTPKLTTVLVSVQEVAENESATTETASQSRSRSRSVSGSRTRSGSGTDLVSPSGSEKSEENKTSDIGKPKESPDPPCSSHNASSTTSSRTCTSPTRKNVHTKSQTSTGLSIEEYVRREASGTGLSEESLQDVIRGLQDERKAKQDQGKEEKEEKQEKKNLLGEPDDHQSGSGSNSGGSRNGSATRSCSVKSI